MSVFVTDSGYGPLFWIQYRRIGYDINWIFHSNSTKFVVVDWVVDLVFSNYCPNPKSSILKVKNTIFVA